MEHLYLKIQLPGVYCISVVVSVRLIVFVIVLL
jgi:hypothetical protein